MAEDWLADVRKYVSDADEGVVGAIVRYCGIALQNKDSSLVAFSDKKETDRVRENYLKKKLGLTQSDSVLDEAIAAVGDIMKGDRTKNRVTVYYLLAEKFGLLNLFGGVAGAVGAATAAAVASDNDDDKSSAAPLAAAAGLAGAAAATGTSAAAEPVRVVSEPTPTAAPAAAYSSYSDDDSSGGGLGWLKWLLLAALLAALLFFGLRYCASHDATPVASDDSAATAGANVDATAGTANGTAGATATATTAAPAGSGVIAADREGKPMLTVYFDTGKSEVSKDLSTAAAGVKDYLAKNAGAKLAVTGYNDPTGNAAANAELSKNRAQGVSKALQAVGIPEESIELVKPTNSTDASGDNTEARRVEVTIK